MTTHAPTTPELMQQPRALAQLLLRAASACPDSGIRSCSGGAESESRLQRYPELLEGALRILAGLRVERPQVGSKVALLLERPEEFFPAFWACLLGGFVPCPLVPVLNDTERWGAQLAHIDRLLEGPLLVTTEALRSQLPSVPGLAVASLESLYRNEPAEQIHEADREDLALLMLTSGSTGNPKAVMLTHSNLLTSMAAKAETLKVSDADTTLNWVSFDHIASLLEGHLLPLYTGANQLHVTSSTILGEPIEFLRLISQHRVTITYVPNFLLSPLTSAAAYLPSSALDLTCVRKIISGGEAVVCATAQSFLNRFAPSGLDRSALWPGFGMTETCAGSFFSDAFPDIDLGQEFASLGKPLDGLRIRIVDDKGVELPEGQVGELQLRGPVVAPGYFNNEAATRQAHTPDGWFRTGDLGWINDGRLALAGRSKDSIIINGVNYYSHDIETVIEQLDGVAQSYVAAFPTRPQGSNTEQLVIAVGPTIADDDEPGMHRLLTAIRNSVVMRWGFRPWLILPLPRESFPKTSLGKIQHSLLRQRLEAGEFTPRVDWITDLMMRQLGGYTAPQGTTERAVAAIYADIFEVAPEQISATASFFDLGGTSLDILRLRYRVQHDLGVADLPIITVLSAPTIRTLAARLATDGTSAPHKYDPVVPLQISGDKTPLFCVHPGIGEVLVFVDLAKYFVNDRPFYALRARGFNEGEQPFTSFHEMVTCYAQAIRTKQSHGPYAVAGYSYGCAVAFEIAKALESQGEHVDFVGIINSTPHINSSFNLLPHIKHFLNEIGFIDDAISLAVLLALINQKQSLELPPQWRELPQERQLEYLLQIAPKERLAELDLTLEKFTAWAKVAHALAGLGRRYQPSGTVTSMSVFYAAPVHGAKEDWLAQELRRWDYFTDEPARYIDVPGEHETLMGPHHVAAFQAILRQELDRALGGK
jgi:acyl-CoA synthetase (AMP-forming)/AMP-acid ligase II/thioesterase domain-containing protein